MIRVIIVDDELPALKIAESVLKTCDGVNVCGSYSDQDELMEALPMLDVDLIFLDIKMPGMLGLELAGRINEIKPEVAIVFVTAYDSYAVDAFEIEAFDYILKPLTADRINKTLMRYKKRRAEQGAPKSIVMCLFVHSDDFRWFRSKAKQCNFGRPRRKNSWLF